MKSDLDRAALFVKCLLQRQPYHAALDASGGGFSAGLHPLWRPLHQPLTRAQLSTELDVREHNFSRSFQLKPYNTPKRIIP